MANEQSRRWRCSVIVADGQHCGVLATQGSTHRTAQAQIEGLIALDLGVVNDGDAEGPAGLVGSKVERAGGRDVIAALVCQAIIHVAFDEAEVVVCLVIDG